MMSSKPIQAAAATDRSNIAPQVAQCQDNACIASTPSPSSSPINSNTRIHNHRHENGFSRRHHKNLKNHHRNHSPASNRSSSSSSNHLNNNHRTNNNGTKNANNNKNKKLFPHKLWELINDKAFAYCLRWSDNGEMVYLNRDSFEQTYLRTAQNQFHTQKAISFVRQMNMYGFRKVDDCYYENSNFRRDCEHLLKNMIRKHTSKQISHNNNIQFELQLHQHYQHQHQHQQSDYHHHFEQPASAETRLAPNYRLSAASLLAPPTAELTVAGNYNKSLSNNQAANLSPNSSPSSCSSLSPVSSPGASTSLLVADSYQSQLAAAVSNRFDYSEKLFAAKTIDSDDHHNTADMHKSLSPAMSSHSDCSCPRASSPLQQQPGTLVHDNMAATQILALLPIILGQQQPLLPTASAFLGASQSPLDLSTGAAGSAHIDLSVLQLGILQLQSLLVQAGLPIPPSTPPSVLSQPIQTPSFNFNDNISDNTNRFNNTDINDNHNNFISSNEFYEQPTNNLTPNYVDLLNSTIFQKNHTFNNDFAPPSPAKKPKSTSSTN